MSSALPEGTLTFLFTDLEGSTRLLHSLGENYGALLAQHRHLIRDVVTANGGYEFGSSGDAVFVVFESASAALVAAVEAQRALAAHPWPPDTSVKVRMAAHTGEARLVEGEYVGIPLHVVARLCAAAHGGQVLLSAVTRALVPRVEVVALGTHRLRDVPDELEIFQLGATAKFPPLRTLSSRPNNLPASTDRLIGRELEMMEITLDLHEHRLVTLTGPGGSGKTRLAIEVATVEVPSFPDGVWLVELSAASSSDEVAAAVAQELHVAAPVGLTLPAALQEQLARKALLIVLDNCEHLLKATAVLVERLLRHCPHLRVLATSRELLGVRGEVVMAIPPLAVGDRDHPGDAVELFVERAGEVVPGFSAALEEVALMVELCRRLDGLPLAIELAAARRRTFALPQLVDRLDQGLRLLSSGGNTAPTRHQALEAVVGWSYDLLEPQEQLLFTSLSVFPDSFPVAAVEHIAGLSGVETLGRLIDKSLVTTLPDGGAYRYRLLETLRQYGRDRLVERGGIESAQSQLVDWVMTLVTRLEQDMRTSRQDAAILAALPERANARAALGWVLEHNNISDALRIVSAVPLLPTNERYDVLLRLLDRALDTPDQVRAQVLLTLTNLSMERGAWDDSIRFARESAALFDGLGEERLAAWARHFEVFAVWGMADQRDRARALAQTMTETFRRIGDDFGLAYALWPAAQFEDDLDSATAIAAEAEALFRTQGATFGLAHALEGRALIALRAAPFTAAETALAEALTIFAHADNFGCTAHCLEAVAALLAQRGQVEDAAVMLGAAESLRVEVGQQHRGWEREGRRRTEQALSQYPQDQITDAQRRGRHLKLPDSVAMAQRLLVGVAERTAVM